MKKLLSISKKGFMKIKCSGIKYRQGFVEIDRGVHDGFVNLEVWTVHPDSSNYESARALSEISEHEISSNSEIELDVEQAKSLVAEIQKAISAIESGNA